MKKSCHLFVTEHSCNIVALTCKLHTCGSLQQIADSSIAEFWEILPKNYVNETNSKEMQSL